VKGWLGETCADDGVVRIDGSLVRIIPERLVRRRLVLRLCKVSNECLSSAERVGCG